MSVIMSEMNYTHYRSKLLHHLDTVVAIQAGKVPPPINVEIDSCNVCSLGCQSCHFAHTHSRGPYASKLPRSHYANTGDMLDTGLACSILRQLAHVGVKSVTWTGGGEPTLHKEFARITTVGHTCVLDQGLYTNACHITPEMAKTLGRTLKWAYVSLDCENKETYLKEKRVDLFDRACEGAKLLCTHVDTVGIGFLMHARNVESMPKMAKLAHKLGGTYVQFRPTISFDASNPSVSSEKSRSWARTIATMDLPASKIPIELDRDRFSHYANWEGHGYHECKWSALQTVITPDGRVWTCCNKRGMEGEALGDLNHETFKDIWARRPIAKVNDQCRVMCRGQMVNKFLHHIESPRPHQNFV